MFRGGQPPRKSELCQLGLAETLQGSVAVPHSPSSIRDLWVWEGPQGSGILREEQGLPVAMLISELNYQIWSWLCP